MKKRNIKYIKLVASTLAFTSILSACSKKQNENVTPETIYVYVTATPTPIPEVEETLNSNASTPSIPEIIESTNQTTYIEPSETAIQTSETAQTSETTQTSEATQTSETTIQSQSNNDDFWADDTWFFLSDDPYTLPTIETNPNDDGYIEDGEFDSLLRIYDAFQRIDNSVNNFDYQAAIESAKQEVRQLIDFIFYGAEMNGTTFEELTEDARQAVYSRLQALDQRIMQYDPDYKEQMGELYNRVQDYASTTLNRAREIINGHIDIDINVYPNSETTTMNAPRNRLLKKIRK